VGAQAVDPEFPPEFVADCRLRYGREGAPPEDFVRCRREGRSFPVDYPMPRDHETVGEHIVAVIEGLGVHETAMGQAWQSTEADKRVFAGPSESDIAALPHIDDAFVVAEHICEDVGLRADTWTPSGLDRAHVRYGVLLDWATRDVAQRMARERDDVSHDDAYVLYGLDPYRVALEHGAEPYQLDEVVARAGLRAPGTLSPDRLPSQRSRSSLLSRLKRK
jgi:hypothetical protein